MSENNNTIKDFLKSGWRKMFNPANAPKLNDSSIKEDIAKMFEILARDTPEGKKVILSNDETFTLDTIPNTSVIRDELIRDSLTRMDNAVIQKQLAENDGDHEKKLASIAQFISIDTVLREVIPNPEELANVIKSVEVSAELGHRLSDEHSKLLTIEKNLARGENEKDPSMSFDDIDDYVMARNTLDPEYMANLHETIDRLFNVLGKDEDGQLTYKRSDGTKVTVGNLPYTNDVKKELFTDSLSSLEVSLSGMRNESDTYENRLHFYDEAIKISKAIYDSAEKDHDLSELLYEPLKTRRDINTIFILASNNKASVDSLYHSMDGDVPTYVPKELTDKDPGLSAALKCIHDNTYLREELLSGVHEGNYDERIKQYDKNIEAAKDSLRDAGKMYFDAVINPMQSKHIQGLENYSKEDLKDIVKDYVNEKFDSEEGALLIKGIEVYGSRGRGTAKANSDLDVVVEYEGDWKEDAVFNILHEEGLTIDGVPVDINPITRGLSGTMLLYMDKVREYDRQYFMEHAKEHTIGNLRESRQLSNESILRLYENERNQVGYSGFYKDVLNRNASWREAVQNLYDMASSSYDDAKNYTGKDFGDIWKQGNEFEEAADTLLTRINATDVWKQDYPDHDYLFAIKRGDMQSAQRMVIEAAERAGYSSDSSYQGQSAFNGAAPWGNGYFNSPEERKEIWETKPEEFDGDHTLSDYINSGIDSHNLEFLALDPRGYDTADANRKEAILNIRNAINAKSATITMYRSVPSDVKEESFRNGDWITPSKGYAIENAELHGWGDKYRIIEQKVPTGDIWWDGNDIAEWGYGREIDYVNNKDFAYKNTANNKKSLETVVYDDNGQIIPLSKRFNENVGDIRYHSGEKLTEVGREEALLREVLIDKLRSADIDVITDVSEGQYVLARERASARTMSFGDAYDYDKYPLGRVEPNLAEANINIVVANPNHGFKDYREARDWAYSNICRTYDEEETGGKGIVKINTEVVSKYVSNPAREKSDSDDLHYAVLKVLPDLIREGIDAETHPNFNKINKERKPENGMDKNHLMHRVYAAVSVNGSLCRVKISMKENMTGNNIPNKPYSYEVTDISTKIEPLGTIDVQARSENGIPISSITGAKLLKNVEMSYDKGKKLLDESEKISKNIRKQRVYHGSGANFDKFDLSYIRQGEGNLAFGWGVYVTSSKAIGKSYARLMDEDLTRIMHAYRFSNGQRFLKRWPSLDSFLSDEKVKASGWSEEEKENYYNSHSKEAEPYHHLYEVEIPDDNDENYLTWKSPLSSEQIETILIGLANLMDNPSVSDNLKKKLLEWNNGYAPVINVTPGMTGEKTYTTISENLLDEDTSKFLSSLGFTGIKYPAGTIFGGTKVGDTNYVIFNADDLKIKDHLRFFKSHEGEVYGFTVGGKIYVDPRIATAETPIHEYTHLWATALQKGNPKEWSNIVGMMKETPLWNEVLANYKNLKTDDEIADEVLATYSGKKGAEKLRKMQEGLKADGTTAAEKSTLQRGIYQVQQALNKFWKEVASFLGIHYVNAEQVADQVMKDMLNGINPERQLKAFIEDRNKEYMEAIKDGNMEKAYELVLEQADMMLADNVMPETTDAFAVRKDILPSNTIKVYKTFTLDKEGNPTAMYVSGKDKLPMGVWLDAQDSWHFTAANGKQYIPSTRNPNGRGNKTGTSVPIPNDEVRQELIKRGFLPEGSKAKSITALAYRPGWHAADLPYFPQGGKQDSESNYGHVHRHNQVVFECELSAGKDYTDVARSQAKAVKADGTINVREADLQWMPRDGFYQYTTNPFLPDSEKGHWYIGGTLRINRALTQEECDKILTDNGKAVQEWQQGHLDLAKLNYVSSISHIKPILSPVAYYENGDIVPLSERFKTFKEEMEPMKKKKIYNPRSWIPPVRGEWTKEKILRRLKQGGSSIGESVAARRICEFDSPQELKEHMFYHGTVYGHGKLKPSITMSDRDVERYGGGGYGDKYWGISLTSDKKIASRFSGIHSYVNILPVILVKGATVKEMPDLQDAADLEDHITDLWKEGVDAVWIGDKNKGEKELCVLNPSAIVNINRADYYKAYQLGTEENPLHVIDDGGIDKLYKDAHEFVSLLEQKPHAPNSPSCFIKKDGVYVTDDDGRPIWKDSKTYQKEKEAYEKEKEAFYSSDEYLEYKEQESSARSKIRFMLAGQNGAKLMDTAEGLSPQEASSRLSMLQVAKTMNMEKKDAKLIKSVTGWELGADDLWRYEISDIKKFDYYGNMVYERNHPEFHRYQELLQKEADHIFDEGEALRPSENDELDILREKYEDIQMKMDDNHTLEAYVDAPEVFKAYPDIKRINVELRPLNDSVLASYEHPSIFSSFLDSLDGVNKYGTITLNSNKVSRFTPTDEVGRYLSHEVMHAVQERESFARGGSLSTTREELQNLLREKADHKDYIVNHLKMWATLESASKKLEMYKQYGPDTEIGKLKRFSWYWDAMNEIDSNMDDRFKLKNDYEKDLGKDKDARQISESGYHVNEAIEELKRVAQEYKNELTDNDYVDLARMNKIEKAIDTCSDTELYHNLAGEVEARNVETRFGMTPLQRRNSLVSETEDVNRQDQIVILSTPSVQACVTTPTEGRWHTRDNKEKELYSRYGKDLARVLLTKKNPMNEKVWTQAGKTNYDVSGYEIPAVSNFMLNLTSAERQVKYPIYFTENQIQALGLETSYKAKPIKTEIRTDVDTEIVNVYNIHDVYDKSLCLEKDPKYLSLFKDRFEKNGLVVSSLSAFPTDKYPELGLNKTVGDYDNKEDYYKDVCSALVDNIKEKLGDTYEQRSESDLLSSLSKAMLGMEYGFKSEMSGKGNVQLAARLERDPDYTKDILNKATALKVRVDTAIEEVVRTFGDDKKLDLRSLTPVDFDVDGNGIVESEENLVADTKQGEEESHNESETTKKHARLKVG